MHQWHQDQHYSIPLWGLANIYKILTASNGAESTNKSCGRLNVTQKASLVAQDKVRV